MPICLEALIEEINEDREKKRKRLMMRRRNIIAELGNIEDELGLERSIMPRHKRREQSMGDEVV
jgi:hypothetical protein